MTPTQVGLRLPLGATKTLGSLVAPAARHPGNGGKKDGELQDASALLCDALPMFTILCAIGLFRFTIAIAGISTPLHASFQNILQRCSLCLQYASVLDSFQGKVTLGEKALPAKIDVPLCHPNKNEYACLELLLG